MGILPACVTFSISCLILKKPRGEHQNSLTRVTDCVGAGNQTQVICKSNKCSQLLKHFFKPQRSVFRDLFLIMCVCVYVFLCVYIYSHELREVGGQKISRYPLDMEL